MSIKTKAVLSMTVLTLISPHALAQPDEGMTEFDEVVVTAQVLYSDQVNALKSPTPIIDVPQSLSIVTADQIALRGFDSVGQIIDYTPGVNSSQGEGHRDAVVFRGVRSTADFFIDGVRDDVQYFRPLYNLEQVELLRGPNALLFGRGGTGGLINRVSKKATIDESFTGFSASYDSFGGADLQLDHNMAATDDLGLRFNAMFESLQNHRDYYDGERIGLNPTAHFILSPKTTLDLSWEYLDHQRFIDRGIPTGTDGEPVQDFIDIVFGDPELNTTELSANILRASLEQQFSDSLKGRLTASYNDYDKLYQNLYASSYDQATDPTHIGLDGYVDTTQRQSFTLTGDLIGEFQTGQIGHMLVVGAELIDSSNDNDRFNTFWSETADDVEFFEITDPLNLSGGVGVNFGGNATSNDFSSDLQDRTAAEIQVMSAYIHDEIALSDSFDIILGLRFDRFDFDVDVTDPVAFDLGSVVTTHYSNTNEEISPRGGLVYKPADNVSLYASYSESFLPASGEQFASISDSSARGVDRYENAEIGAKWDMNSGLSLTAAYFQSEQEDTQRDTLTEEDFQQRGLEIEGFEFQLQGQLTEQLYLNAGYSHLEGKTDNGTELPRELPENMFSAWGQYQFTDRLVLGLGVTHQDESFISDLDIGDDPDAHPTLPAYTRLDAMISYDLTDSLRAQLNIENLTDEIYYPTAHSTHQVTVGEPLNARFTLSGQF